MIEIQITVEAVDEICSTVMFLGFTGLVMFGLYIVHKAFYYD
jgi:hypothetical protein